MHPYVPSLLETVTGSSGQAASHHSQLNSGSFAELMPVEKSGLYPSIKVLKLSSQKSVVHPGSEVRDLISLMRAGGTKKKKKIGSQQQNQSRAQKGAKGQGDSTEGKARFWEGFFQQKGKAFLGAGVTRQGSRQEADC